VRTHWVASLPNRFRDLDRWARKWAVASAAERATLRAASTAEEMREFYDAVLPHLADALAYLQQFPVTDIPASAQRLLFLILALAEVSTFVEFYDGECRVPNAFAEDRLVAVHKDYLS
jgi:histidinol-phosphate/aromatic aminotransferase/cobyric acid decarboxylase-like protein